MRLHSLRATAFGPFADTVQVDFDDLSDAGLFLLTGATGAGKSSVLDAVCFGLYGQVPGDRHTARHLRCDQAPDGRAPEVVLEVSIRSRRFRFTRSPQWERAKRRGSGTTKVQAHVVVEELRDGDWCGLTTRLDDAGLLVTDLLGMTCAQFTQVALLPQGQFMTFLRARSQDRQAVLQRLFRTDRFEQVERWLVERRIALRRTNQAANDRLAGVLARIQESAEVAAPEDWDLADLALPTSDGVVSEWASTLTEAAQATAQEAAATREHALSQASRARAELESAERLATLQQRGNRATEARAALDARRSAVDTDRSRLDGHERSTPVLRLADSADLLARAVEETGQRLRASLEAAADLLAGIDPTTEHLDEAHRAATAALAVAESFLPRERALRQERERCRALAVRVDKDERNLASFREQLDGIPERLETVRSERDAARLTAADLPELRQAARDAATRLADAEQLASLNDELATAEGDLAQARAFAQQQREVYLDLREARITGMAAELASSLVSGCACPVCGSAAHPSPATPNAGAVGRREEEDARRAHEQAAFDQQVREHRVNDLRSAVSTLADALDGLTAPVAATALVACDQAVEVAEHALVSVDRLDREVDRLASLRDAGQQRLHRLELAHAQAVAARESARAKVEQLTDELATLLEGSDAATVPELVDRRRHDGDLLGAVREAQQAHHQARRSHDQASTAAVQAAVDAGFADPAEARAAALSDEEVAELTRRVRAFDEEEATVAVTLADPEVQRALAEPAPDLETLRAVAGAAEDARDAAVSAADSAARRHRRLLELGTDLEEQIASWAPLRTDLATVTGLAALVEGKGPDNPLRIRLSAYVLAERLRQVVAAANERLLRMSGGRYTLEHTDEKGAGDQRGGLGLLVLDSWSGHTRDPATLSGGETFVVSLALALGLADTVSHEAGGTDIDTLFIDEGFGSLDAATLDDVMDTLDTLREGGRVVGLVSHVAELRTRIPTQLEVRTSRGGSTVRPVLASG